MQTPKNFVVVGAFILMVAAFFTATQPITPTMSVVSAVFVVLFALPSYYALVKTHGRYGLYILAMLGFYALVIETLAIHTSFPYGSFIYNDLLGQKIFGLTPWTIAFAWPPILLLAYTIASRTRLNLVHKFSTFNIIGMTAIFAMVIDLVLDPGAVALGFWSWETGGFFYNVPLVNFLGWLLTGFIGASLLHIFNRNKKVSKQYAYSGILIVWFWTWVNVFLLHIIPAVVGFALLAFFFRKIQAISV